MADLWMDIREIDRRGWFVIATALVGQISMSILALVGSRFAVVFLALVGFSYVMLLQLTRVILTSTLELAKESTGAWRTEADLVQELVEDYADTISDLKRYDLQASGVHLERLRTMMIKRHPELEDEIAEVEHPLNMAAFVI